MADILLRQSKGKILVGDPHQQIYAFRGAINAMQAVNASHTFYLTQVTNLTVRALEKVSLSTKELNHNAQKVSELYV